MQLLRAVQSAKHSSFCTLLRCRVRFVLLPTAYGFAAGHCVRVAIAGADSKHFTVDHQGDRTIWVHTGGAALSHPNLTSEPSMLP
jgi:predicted acyl esterase